MMGNVLNAKQKPRPYANLSEIRKAIQRRRLIRFQHNGGEVLIEPHLLGKGVRTGAYYLKGFDSAEGTWTYYRFCEVRGVEETRDCFVPRSDVWEGERKIVELDTQARW